MANTKFVYHVGVMEDNRVKFVTDVYPNHTAVWEDDKAALAMAEKVADEMTMGLIWNGFIAMTIKVPNGVCLVNSEK